MTVERPKGIKELVKEVQIGLREVAKNPPKDIKSVKSLLERFESKMMGSYKEWDK